MCGRFVSTTTDPEKLKETFNINEIKLESLEPRYNIAPTQNILTIVGDSDGQRFLGTMRWGFIPSWHKDPAKLNGQINARGETVAEKPTFRNAFKKRRCLIVADGFYEWQAQKSGPKVPVYIHLKEEAPFGMAGLWERWTHPETGEVWITCTIVTTSANDLISSIHVRMPVILAPEDYGLWLNPEADNQAELQHLIRPFPADQMAYYPVSTQVNNVRNDNPSLIEKAS